MNTANDTVNAPSILMRVLGLVFALMSAAGLVASCLSPVVSLLQVALDAGTAPTDEALQAALFAGVVGSGASVVGSIVRLAFGIIGVLGGTFTFLAGSRLAELRSRGLVQFGAVLVAAQPVLWFVTSCCTSNCGFCGYVVWVPFVILGVVTCVLVFNVLSDPDVDAAFAANDGE